MPGLQKLFDLGSKVTRCMNRWTKTILLMNLGLKHGHMVDSNRISHSMTASSVASDPVPTLTAPLGHIGEWRLDSQQFLPWFEVLKWSILSKNHRVTVHKKRF